ncbi:hypothetical protein DSM3645_03273 [Blastopirellula marina DSM 3645]|uniref:Uncharacterized protein n=1 Tax=Blastopirellula marina DSM 3645 TaxID=314230 RepID=A3ZVW8_9BACT|nr:hypothetical protein DSM3645_03273 [Blastopirellula marina DSM 3645]
MEIVSPVRDALGADCFAVLAAAGRHQFAVPLSAAVQRDPNAGARK